MRDGDGAWPEMKNRARLPGQAGAVISGS